MEKDMKVRLRDLSGENECTRRRSRNIDLAESSTPVMRFAALQIETAKRAIRGEINLPEIAPIITQGALEIDFKSEETRWLKTEDAVKRVERLVKSVLELTCDPRKKSIVLTSLPRKDITIATPNGDVVVEGVAPDLVIIGDTEVKGYLFKTGKPTADGGKVYGQNQAKADKRLYALMKYTEGLVPAGKYVEIYAGFAFFRKGSDRTENSRNRYHFDPDFFVNADMKTSDNIVSLYEVFVGGSTTATKLDKEFVPAFTKYADGMSPDECTEAQCMNCSMNEVCHYTHSPICLEDMEKQTDIRSISLSPTQTRIELYTKGYAVVNAVPGAGKTLVLVLRIINLLLNGVKPEEIAIITFTNSGAEVFKNRIAMYNEDIGTGENVGKMTATTFNGLGQKILEKEYQMFGFSKAPRVIDPIERSAIIDRLLNQHPVIQGLDYRNYAVDMPACKGPLAVASKAFQVMKAKGYTQLDAEAISREVGPAFCPKDAARELAQLYDKYNQYLKDAGLVEYADQEMMILDLLSRDPYYFDQFHWKHILVDECQDTSENQFRLIKYMTDTRSFESLMCVGDDSQSIYGFRDTSPKFFINFEETLGLDKGKADAFYMVDNFRSTPEIVHFANQIVEKNIWKVQKDIETSNPSGKPVVVKGFFDQAEEYEWIVDLIRKKMDEGIAPEQIAFIAYSRTELIKMADLLTMQDIPSVMLNPERYLENARVLAGLALARAFVDQNPKDLLVCLNAIHKGDVLMLSDEEIAKQSEALKENILMARSLPEEEMKEKFFEYLDIFDENDEVFQAFVFTLRSQPTMAAVFDYCGDFFDYGEHAEIRREHNYPGVVLTTAHSSKGMEWKVVINSLTKYDSKELHSGNNRQAQEEERRRLLFVSATRAREELYITGKYAAYGSKKDRTYNMFLMEAAECVGTPFDAAKIANEEYFRDKMKREKREAEKKQKEAELKASLAG